MIYKRRNGAKMLIYMMICFVLSFMFLRSEIGFPAVISYFGDAVNILLFFYILKRKRISKSYTIFKRYIIIFFIYTIITLLIHQQAFTLYLWGLRNNFRFYIFFLACGLILDSVDYHKIIGILYKVVYLNVIICTYQFFFLGIRRDALGGLFGTDQGCNGYMNVLLLITCVHIIICYLDHREKVSKCVMIICSAIYISILSEIKVFYVELAMIVLLANLFTKFTFRKLALSILGIIAIILVGNGIAHYYPEWAGTFSVKGLFETITSTGGYTSSGDLNRLTAISTINTRIPQMFSSITGMGLGSCEYSTNYAFLTSDFYRLYSSWHYQWISIAWIYLELGYLGLFIYCLFFVIVFILCLKNKSKLSIDKSLLRTTMIIAIMCLILIFYNTSLRMESAYLVYFILSVPVMMGKKKESNFSPAILHESEARIV